MCRASAPIAAFAQPWSGEAAVWRSARTDGFELLDRVTGRARIGTLAFDLYAGPSGGSTSATS